MKNEASIEIQLSLSLSYSLIYQGEASPLKGSSHPWVRWRVPILAPFTSIYSPMATFLLPSFQPSCGATWRGTVRDTLP